MLREILIGRDVNCDIVIDPQYKWVSGKHAVVFYNPRGELVYRDTSRNGTVINGQNVKNTEVVVVPGMPIMLAGNCPLPWDKVQQLMPAPYLGANQQYAPAQAPYPQQPSPAPMPQQRPSQQPINLISGESRPMHIDMTSEDEHFLTSWNWGAFFLTPCWGFGNGCWWAFLLLFFPLIGNVVMGLFGTRLAWKNKKWDNFYQFRITQDTWTKAGIIMFLFSLAILIIWVILLTTIITSLR